MQQGSICCFGSFVPQQKHVACLTYEPSKPLQQSCTVTVHFRCLSSTRAIRDIAAGEEVTISYVELAATRHERRQELLQHYFFDIDAVQHGPPHMQEEQQQQPQPQPQQQQQQQQQQQSRWQLEEGATLVSYGGTTGQPPWPQDPADAQLTRMVLAGAGGTVQLLIGGMHACFVQSSQHKPDAGECNSIKGCSQHCSMIDKMHCYTRPAMMCSAVLCSLRGLTLAQALTCCTRVVHLLQTVHLAWVRMPKMQSHRH